MLNELPRLYQIHGGTTLTLRDGDEGGGVSLSTFATGVLKSADSSTRLEVSAKASPSHGPPYRRVDATQSVIAFHSLEKLEYCANDSDAP